MKRLIFCFDGTWNRIDSEYPTNVAKVAQSIAHADGDIPQLIYYDQGVGTNKSDQWTGGMFGHGLFANVVDAYHTLVLNHEPGDQIFVFGFSRGAFTARSFVGLVRHCGIMSRRALPMIGAAIQLYRDRTRDTKPGAEATREFRYLHRPELALPGDVEWRRIRYPEDDRPVVDLTIRYLGVWDTVGALGIPAQLAPDELFRREYQFHDCDLNEMVEAARHAVAADERRRTFDPALWDNLDALNAGPPPHRYRQMIFPGTHGSVGGGGAVTGLSDEALLWVLDGARAQGLAVDTDPDSPIHQIRPDHRAALLNNEHSSSDWVKDWLMGIGFGDRDFKNLDITSVHDSLIRRFHEPKSALPERVRYRPASLKALWSAIETAGSDVVVTDTKSQEQDAALRSPDRVEAYTVVAGDTLSGLAARFLGDARHCDLLFRHNQMLGRMHDADRLYVGQVLEIPIYDEPAASGAEHPDAAG